MKSKCSGLPRPARSPLRRRLRAPHAHCATSPRRPAPLSLRSHGRKERVVFGDMASIAQWVGSCLCNSCSFVQSPRGCDHVSTPGVRLRRPRCLGAGGLGHKSRVVPGAWRARVLKDATSRILDDYDPWRGIRRGNRPGRSAALSIRPYSFFTNPALERIAGLCATALILSFG